MHNNRQDRQIRQHVKPISVDVICINIVRLTGKISPESPFSLVPAFLGISGDDMLGRSPKWPKLFDSCRSAMLLRLCQREIAGAHIVCIPSSQSSRLGQKIVQCLNTSCAIFRHTLKRILNFCNSGITALEVIYQTLETVSQFIGKSKHREERHFSQSIYQEGSTRRRTSLLKRKVGQRTIHNCLG